MILVADCSPLIALAACDGLFLLEPLFAMAKINYINTIGSFGVLLAAKQSHLIDQITPFVARLKASDIYVSDALIATVMDIAGEKWPG